MALRGETGSKASDERMAETYDFHTLSPLDFEELVRDLLQADWGVRLESFGPGRDAGVDIRLLNGPNETIIQAKHLLGSGYRALVRAAKEEREKAIALAPARYVLATSVSLTRVRKDEVVRAMPGVPLVPDDIFGQEDLNNLLRRHDRIQLSHFKLWLSSSAVLDRILHSGVYNRTAAEMDIIREMVPRFVHNRSVPDAEQKLEETGALIIAGQPGVGKTTLARILLWLHAEQGWKIFVVDTLEEALSVAETGEKRLILLDDFLGQVRLSSDHVRGIDARLPPLLSRVAANDDLRFILTTRDYILAQARGLSARLAPGKINAREYVLNVGHYTRSVKARILYNHLYFSALAPEQRKAVLHDDFFLKIIDHKNFNPRLIEEITSPDYLALTDRPVRETIEAVLANPELLWERPYRQHISPEGRMMMLALFLNGRGVGVAALKASYVRVARAVGAELHPSEVESSFRSTFRVLEGSVLGLSLGIVSFTNPGLRDFLQSVVTGDQLVPILLKEVETPREIGELWAVFLATKPSDAEKAQLADAWTAALDRMHEGGHADLYDYIELVSEICAALEYQPLEERLEQSLDDFEQSSFTASDVSTACGLLERSWGTTLRWQLERRFRDVTSEAAAQLLINSADELSFEDVQSLDEALHTYGNNAARALEASHEAMASIERYVDQEIREIKTVEDLDEYEETLVEFLKKRSFDVGKVVYDIQYRREQLVEEGRLENHSTYRGGGSAAPEMDMSSSDIRSMFRGLTS